MQSTLLEGDALLMLRQLRSESVQCVVTSPAYFQLRDYGTATWVGGDPACDHVERRMHLARGSTLRNDGRPRPGMQETDKTHGQALHYKGTCGKCGAERVDLQMGSEATPELYVQALVDVFREIRRVLHPSGIIWLNLGDSYAGSNKGVMGDGSLVGGPKQRTNGGTMMGGISKTPTFDRIKEKDLIGIPWMVAFALRADGWYLRQDIIWEKPQVMPESVQDRCTKSHEYVFLLSKRRTYFYDNYAIAEPAKVWTGQAARFTRTGPVSEHILPGQSAAEHRSNRTDTVTTTTRNKRSVWTINTRPTGVEHYATFPPELARICVLAGTSAHGACRACGAPYRRLVEKKMPPLRVVQSNGPGATHGLLGTARFDEPIERTTVGWEPTCKCNTDEISPCVVLDPFCGSGTVGEVCVELGRDFIGIDLSAANIDLSTQRVDIALLKEVMG